MTSILEGISQLLLSNCVSLWTTPRSFTTSYLNHDFIQFLKNTYAATISYTPQCTKISVNEYVARPQFIKKPSVICKCAIDLTIPPFAQTYMHRLACSQVIS